ncbi:serpin family protein [Gracilibacillus phocaeensis]|uniref:serpin family protein n=1 Tax=Gracilibacillus phocaeensis TaxID=2042304 RepID=UPI0013EF5626|nr:serpin family protein [Gracilibacillus phocaeensis]
MKKLMCVFAFLLLVACGTNNSDQEEGESGQTVNEEIPEKVNQLGLEGLAQVDPNEAGNRFLSPVSIWLAMNMAYHGTSGETKTEIEQAFGIENVNGEELSTANHTLLTNIGETEEEIELSLANSLWLNEAFTLQPGYQEQVEKQYLAQLEPITTADAINNWVAEQTNDRIEQMIDQVDPSLAVLLLNAIYFQGPWTYPFNEELTEDSDFHLSDGDTKQTSFMRLSEDLAYFEDEEVQVVALPYGEEETIQMQIFLPSEKLDFEDFQTRFDVEKWQAWTKEMQTENGSVSLPSFEFEYETELNQAFQQMGIEQAFDPDHADFSEMLDLTESNNAYISDTLHKTFISVDESGTEAAGATSVAIDVTSAPMEEPFQMEINRPFVFTITDTERELILFAGSVEDPTE